MLSIKDWDEYMKQAQPQLVPHIFISYSHRDQIFAERLAQDLKRKGEYKVWLDLEKVRIGDPIIEKIDEGIKESDFLVIILSSNSVSSTWVKEELYSALSRQLNQQTIKVLPVLIENCEIPAFLSHRRYANFRPGRDYDEALAELLKAIDPSFTTRVSNNNYDMASVEPKITIDRKRFAELLRVYFDMEEFKSLCFALHENYDDLRGETLRRNTEELISKLARQDRLSELIDLVRKERPNAPWNDIFISK